MTQENKKLLLKDLCARLPYKVKGNYQNSDDELLRNITIMHRYLEPNGMVMTGDIKPYLFPMSSMTEKQKEEYCQLQQKIIYNSKGFVNIDIMNYINWCYKNHLDVNGLIPLDLAIDATNKNIY